MAAAAPRQRLGEEADRGCAQRRERARRDDLGPEHDDDVGLERREVVPQPPQREGLELLGPCLAGVQKALFIQRASSRFIAVHSRDRGEIVEPDRELVRAPETPREVHELLLQRPGSPAFVPGLHDGS